MKFIKQEAHRWYLKVQSSSHLFWKLLVKINQIWFLNNTMLKLLSNITISSIIFKNMKYKNIPLESTQCKSDSDTMSTTELVVLIVLCVVIVILILIIVSLLLYILVFKKSPKSNKVHVEEVDMKTVNEKQEQNGVE